MPTRRTTVTASERAPHASAAGTPLLEPDSRATPRMAPRGRGHTGGGRYFAQFPLRQRVLLSQLPLTISVVLVFVFVIAVPQHEQVGHGAGNTPADTPAFFAGVSGVMVLTLAAALIPWDRLPTVAYWSIPLLDFVAIAAIWDSARYALDGMAMLAAFPVFWIAWSGIHPVWGISLGFIGTTAVAWWPYLHDREILPPEDLLRPLLVPLFMLALAVAASVLARSMDRQRDELRDALTVTRTQNRLLSTVLDTTDVGILVTDRHGNDVIMNAAQRRTHLLGLPAGMDDAAEHQLLVFEADGHTPVPVEDRPVYRAVRGESFSGRLIAIGVDGSQQFLSVSAQARKDDGGEFDGTVVVFQNVTDLIDAIRSREQFVADVSHEFRTPLTSIIGYLELAIEDEPDTRIIRYLQTCQRNSERLLALVNSLLDSASGNAAPALEPTDLARLVRHSVESAQVRADNGGITLVTDLPETLPVQADKIKISQVADNLISNAIKYTEPGGAVTVTVRRSGDCAEVEVADNGIGISPEEQEKMFSNFYRTEHVRRAAIPGTGLGLAITRAFVRAHGGEITVVSAPGVGSTFTASIPVNGPSAQSPESPETEEAEDSEESRAR